MDEKVALEDLKFIKKIIDESRSAVLYNGFEYIFWGALVIAGMLFTYISVISHFYFNYMIIWFILIPIGWIVSFFNRKKKMEKQPLTFAGKILATVWGATGVGMTIIGFVGPYSGSFDSMAISPILATIIGGAYYLTGKIVDSKWVSYLSLGWWIGGIIMFFVQGLEQLLVMALLMLLFQTIPGVILYRKYKKEEVIQS